MNVYDVLAFALPLAIFAVGVSTLSPRAAARERARGGSGSIAAAMLGAAIVVVAAILGIALALDGVPEIAGIAVVTAGYVVLAMRMR